MDNQLSAAPIVWGLPSICNPRRVGAHLPSLSCLRAGLWLQIFYAFPLPLPFPFMLPFYFQQMVRKAPLVLCIRGGAPPPLHSTSSSSSENKTCPTLLRHLDPHSELDCDRKGIHATIRAFSKASPSPEDIR